MLKKGNRWIGFPLVVALLAALLAPLAIRPGTAAAAGNYEVIDDFPSAALSGWTSGGGMTGVNASTTSFEGAYSLQLDFAVDNANTSASAYKALGSVSASVYGGLQFRIKGPGVVGSYTIKLTTATGTWQTAPLQFGSFDFTRIYLPWSYFRKSTDMSQVATATDMASVSQFAFQIAKRFGETAAIAGTLYLDDLKWADNRVDEFEAGVGAWSAGANATVTSEKTAANVFDGAKSMKLAADFTSLPVGATATATRAFASAFDVREWNGISLLVKGDNSGNLLSASIRTTGGTTFATKPIAVDFAGWKRLQLYWNQFDQGGYQSPSAADLATIDQTALTVTKQGSSSTTLFVDTVLFTHTNDLFTHLNLSLPALSAVKAQVDAKDYEAAKAALLTYMQSRTSPQYFYNWPNQSAIMNDFNASYPHAIDAIVTLANQAKAYDFTFEGDHRLLDPDGDNDIVWAQGNNVFTQYLARMGWWLDMGKAYWNSRLTTADESYVTEFTASLRDFYLDNPLPYATLFSTFSVSDLASFYVPLGNLWGGLDTGIRLDDWAGAYAFFVNAPSFTAEDNYLFLQSALDQAEYLYGYEGAYRPGNMQIIETYGLYSIAAIFPEFGQAGSWKSRALGFLEQQLDESVLDDGFFKELTFGYHEWMIETFFRLKSLGDLNGETFSPGFNAKLEKMFEVDMKMMDPNGATPPISDSQPFNRRSLLSLGAALYSRGDFKYLSDNKISASYFWSIPAAVRANLANVTAAEPSFLSVRLDEAKYYAMRTQWKDGGNFFVFDGAPYLTGHYHRDQLNVIAESNGDALLVDPGKGNYADYENYPTFFVYNAHNTVSMDTYVNSQYPAPTEHAWETNADYDFVDASVDYSSTVTPVVGNRAPFAAERKVYFAKPDYWIMNDLLAPIDQANPHTYYQQFHLAPSAISIHAATKAVEINNTIDTFEDNSLANYTKSANTAITNVTTNVYEGLRSLKVDYNLAAGGNWFRKNYPYNAQHTSGIAFWLKGDGSANSIKPYLLAPGGNWVSSQTISLNFSGWKEFYLPWRVFAKETDSTISMGPGQAANLSSVDFHFVGTTAGTVYFDKLRFYDSYDIDNFESVRINNFEDGSLTGWTGRLGTPTIDTASFNSGAKSMKYTLTFPSGGTAADFDYARKTQTYDASRLGGIVLAVKGTGSDMKFTSYLKTTNGTATNIWRLRQSYSMNYGGWRVYYLPWRSFVNESTGVELTSADTKSLNFVETRFIKSSSTALNPVVQIDDLGFFDYHQEKDTYSMGLDAWTATTANASVSLDATTKYEGANALKMTFAMAAGDTVAKVQNSGNYIASNNLYGGIALRLKGNGDANNKLRLLLNAYISSPISLADTGWTYFYVPWSDFKLENDSSIAMGEPAAKTLELRVEKNGGSASGSIYVDNIGFVGNEKANLTIVPADPGSIASVDTLFGWVYYNAGRYESAPYIKYVKTATGNASFDTVLYPGRKGNSPQVTVTRLAATENGGAINATLASGLQIDSTVGGVTYSDTYAISHNGTAYAKQYGSYYYDGAKAFVRKTNGAVTQTVKDAGSVLTRFAAHDDFESGALPDWSRDAANSSAFASDTSTAAESLASGKLTANFPAGSSASAATWIRKNPAAALNATGYGGLRFWVKGNGTNYLLTPIVTTNYGGVTRTFRADATAVTLSSAGWSSVFVPWSSFAGLSAYMGDLASVDYLQFEIQKNNGANADNGEVNIDQLMLASE